MNRPLKTCGYSLFEMLTYISVLAVVMCGAFVAYFNAQQNAANLHRNADDIVRILNVGEQWREDVRAAIAQPQITADGQFVIPQKSGAIIYTYDGSVVRRKTGENAQEVPVLKGVKTSHIQMDRGQQVNSWRWELELQTQQRKVRIQPLFSFQAVTTTKQ